MIKDIKSFSYSSISSCENCPKSFEFRYIKKIPEAFQSIEAFMGGIVHKVLERLYAERENGINIKNEELTDIYRENWEISYGNKIKIVNGDKNTQHYIDLGIEQLNNFYKNIFMTDRSRSVMLEEKFSVELPNGIIYRGIIDRVARLGDGRIRVVDYKTGTVGEPLDTLQLPSYSIHIFESNPLETELEICYEDLKKGLTKTALIIKEDVKEIKSEIASKIVQIRSMKDFPAKPSSLCKWCGYNEICEDYLKLTGSETDSLKHCPECGSILIERKGKFGKFLGCSDYPNCRYTLDLGPASEDVSGDSICPECGGILRERKGKFGKFLGCSNYPDCRFTRKIK